MPDSSILDIHNDVAEHLKKLRHCISSVYRGDAKGVNLLVTAFIAGGHALIEDIPGVGKTTIGRALAAAIGGNFQRLQCTPDLMPADITGLSIYDERERSFTFHPGPIFCDILLADELNRTPPRTQSALLEAMSEGQVTVDGKSRKLSPIFFCVATQNPVDHVGTYMLPDSQRDRFILRFPLGYPERDREFDLLKSDGAEQDIQAINQHMPLEAAKQLRQAVRDVHINDDVRNYLMDIIHATRNDRGLSIGASPRAALGLQRACQAAALVDSRNFVTPADLQRLAVPALAHRVTSRSGNNTEHIIRGIIEQVPAPR